MFFGREKELSFLQKCYNSNKAELVFLYGRRRIGKTETLNEFSKDKNAFFYSCREYTDQVQLEAFSTMVLSQEIEAKKYIKSFYNWDDAFKSVLEVKTSNKKLLIIDEFP